MTKIIKIEINSKTIDKVNYLLKDINLTVNDAIKMFLEKTIKEKKFPFKTKEEFNVKVNSLFNDEKIIFDSMEEFLDYCND